MHTYYIYFIIIAAIRTITEFIDIKKRKNLNAKRTGRISGKKPWT